jgi:hypothetical protein
MTPQEDQPPAGVSAGEWRELGARVRADLAAHPGLSPEAAVQRARDANAIETAQRMRRTIALAREQRARDLAPTRDR